MKVNLEKLGEQFIHNIRTIRKEIQKLVAIPPLTSLFFKHYFIKIQFYLEKCRLILKSIFIDNLLKIKISK